MAKVRVGVKIWDYRPHYGHPSADSPSIIRNISSYDLHGDGCTQERRRSWLVHFLKNSPKGLGKRISTDKGA